MGRVAWLWGPAVIWMAILFQISSRGDVGPAGRIPDWLTHGAAYLVLAGLLCRALAGGMKPLPAATAALAACLATAYGVTDEYHQSFVPGRDASAADILKDAVGAAVGAWLFRRAAMRAAIRGARLADASPSPDVGRDGVGGR